MQCSCGGYTKEREHIVDGRAVPYKSCANCGRNYVPTRPEPCASAPDNPEQKAWDF